MTIKGKTELPAKLAQPAARALNNQGVYYLDQVSGLSEAELLSLHGIGQNAVKILKQAIKAHQIDLAIKSKKH